VTASDQSEIEADGKQQISGANQCEGEPTFGCDNRGTTIFSISASDGSEAEAAGEQKITGTNECDAVLGCNNDGRARFVVEATIESSVEADDKQQVTLLVVIISRLMNLLYPHRINQR
jgi:hypothetical protein